MPFLSSRINAAKGFFAGNSVPEAPTILSSSAGDGQLTISFTLPSTDGGVPITKYQYSIDGVTWADTDAGTTSPRVITGLVNGTDYTIRLRAVNPLGRRKSLKFL